MAALESRRSLLMAVLLKDTLRMQGVMGEAAMAPGRGRCGSWAGAVGGGDDVGGGGVQVSAAAWDQGLGVVMTSTLLGVTFAVPVI